MKKAEIMYIECKAGLTGPGKIRRVTYSKSGKTIYCGGLRLKSLKGYGYKSNYYDETTGFHYWVSRPRKDGMDTLYPEKVSIDEDVQEEYWCELRKQPQYLERKWFRSPGKYSRRKPYPELCVSGSIRNGGDRSGKQRRHRKKGKS